MLLQLPARAGGRDRWRPITALPATLSAVLALVLTACSSTPSGDQTTSTSSATAVTTTIPASTSTSTTTSTTTTLPVPVQAGGTSIVRVRVAALPPGASVLPAISPASAAWLRMVPIAFRTFGSGPDLLLVAGQDGSLSWWDSTLLSDLSLQYRVTVFDLPGAGYSGAATAPLSLGWLADMTAGFALSVGLSHPIVLGWGLGGEIALSLAERHPGLASSLVLVDTSGGGAAATQPSRGVAGLLALPGATPLALSELLFPPTTFGLHKRLLWQNSLLQGTPDWLTERTIQAEARLQAAIWKRSPLTAGLSRVTIPALVVSGTNDVVFPPENAYLLDSELPHVKLRMFIDAGYGAITQDEPAFVTALEKFTA
jgi:pimeloyl-ACP methyl ester carboxylesterase